MVDVQNLQAAFENQQRDFAVKIKANEDIVVTLMKEYEEAIEV